MSSLVPKCRQPVGQDFTQAGSRPTATRSTQSVHLDIFPVVAENRGTSNGQPVSHSSQPMHWSGFTSTMPFSYCTMAPGAGHALRQPGSAQCMHWSLRISHDDAAVDLVLVELDQVPEVGVERGSVW